MMDHLVLLNQVDRTRHRRSIRRKDVDDYLDSFSGGRTQAQTRKLRLTFFPQREESFQSSDAERIFDFWVVWGMVRWTIQRGEMHSRRVVAWW